VTECGVNGENIVEFGRVVTSTPARVSCIVSSDRSEEPEITRFHLEPCLESIPPLEESEVCDVKVEVDSVVNGAYPGRCGEEVRQSQETADLGLRRTRSRGSQDVTAADKSEVGPAVRGPRDSGRVRPSVGSMASSGVSVVLVMLWQILYLARAGTFFPSGVEYVILVTLWHTLCSVRRGTAFPLEFRVTVRTGPRTVYMCIMYLVALLYPDCIYLYI